MSDFSEHKYNSENEDGAVIHKWSFLGTRGGLVFTGYEVIDERHKDMSAASLDFHHDFNYSHSDEEPYGDCSLLGKPCWGYGVYARASFELWPEIKPLLKAGNHDAIYRLLEAEYETNMSEVLESLAKPLVHDNVWRAMPGAKAIAWDQGAPLGCAFSEVPTPTSLYEEWAQGDGKVVQLEAELFGNLIQRGTVPWDQAIVLRPEGL